MTTDAPAPAGFVCLQCARVWTSDGQPETNMMALIAAGLELRYNGGPYAPTGTHCDVCDDGRNGPAVIAENERIAMAAAIERMQTALLKEVQRQNNDDSVASPFILHDGNGNSTPLDFSKLAEAAIAVTERKP